MKCKGLLAAIFFAATTLLAVGQTTSQNATASPSNDQGSSAYGNNTYNAGAHNSQPAASNASPTEHDSAIGPSGGANTNANAGSPNASHTSTPAAEGNARDDNSTNPSTVNPGNGNSPSSTPRGAGGSNSGTPPQMNIAAYRFKSGARLMTAALQDQAGSSAQGTAGQQSPSANSVGSQEVPQAPSPDANNNAGLQSRINDALRNEPTLGASHVVANVSDTGIDLTGTVGSIKDKQTAERIASSFDGNRKLTDNISVTGAGHSDLAPNHPAMNNGGTGNTQNPSMENGANPKK